MLVLSDKSFTWCFLTLLFDVKRNVTIFLISDNKNY